MKSVETSIETKPFNLRARIAELTHDVQRGFIAEWAVTIILLLFGTTTLVQAFVIPSASMVGTLLIGDHVLVDKMVFSPHGSLSNAVLPYRPVKRGNIIVFRYPLNISQDYVKRAIGLPGDHIHLVDKKLWLNGHAVDEPYAIHTHPESPELYRDNFPEGAHSYPLRPRAQEMIDNHVKDGELVVPPGYVFAMGDNRDDSDDSRFWGLVPMENIVGTPLIIYWSFDASTQDLTNPNIGIDHLIDIIIHFPQKTRW
ncbi:MAG: signal peptidase I, partial [Acidobacteriota bacterium]|nr:signal peptidase I [Acidobacteriota bacterium]